MEERTRDRTSSRPPTPSATGAPARSPWDRQRCPTTTATSPPWSSRLGAMCSPSPRNGTAFACGTSGPVGCCGRIRCPGRGPGRTSSTSSPGLPTVGACSWSSGSPSRSGTCATASSYGRSGRSARSRRRPGPRTAAVSPPAPGTGGSSCGTGVPGRSRRRRPPGSTPPMTIPTGATTESGRSAGRPTAPGWPWPGSAATFASGVRTPANRSDRRSAGTPTGG